MAAADAGTIGAVIVLALDRLGRKTRIVLDVIEHLTARGIVFVICKESLDTTTPQGQFVLTMFTALAPLERDTIVERTTAGRNERGKSDGERAQRKDHSWPDTPLGLLTRLPRVAVMLRDAEGKPVDSPSTTCAIHDACFSA